MYVIIGCAVHPCEGYGAPRFCSVVVNKKEHAEDAIKMTEVNKHKGFEIEYFILEVGAGFDESVSW